MKYFENNFLAHFQPQLVTGIDEVVALGLSSPDGSQVVVAFLVEIHEPSEHLLPVCLNLHVLHNPGHGGYFPNSGYLCGVEVVQFGGNDDVSLSFGELPDSEDDDGGDCDDGDDDNGCKNEEGHGGQR